MEIVIDSTVRSFFRVLLFESFAGWNLKIGNYSFCLMYSNVQIKLYDCDNDEYGK